MSNSFHNPPSRRRLSTASTTSIRVDNDADLTQSLSQLSIASASRPPKQSSSSSSSSPSLLSARRASTASNAPPRPSHPPQRSSSAAPRPRNPSRSPSVGPISRRGSRAGTPPLTLRRASINSLHSAAGAASGRGSLSRRASHNQLSSPSISSITPEEEEKPPVTANSIASDYFRAELEAHHGPVVTLPTDTVVIINDAVYGHRFSRPRTSRNALSTIVERPERIKASVLGVSTAYVRLGGRHCHGRHPIHPKANIDDATSIPFRIHKTTRRLPLTSPAVTNVHGTKWMAELKLMCDSAEMTLAMGGKELQRRDVPRGPDDPPPQQLHEGDLYLCAESLNAMEGALGAVCEAVDTVFGNGPRKAFVAVRPPGHHCSASHPSGFCWVNNVHVGIMHGALYHGLSHAAIIDFDLHHGDGSQAITWEHNSRATGTKKSEAHWKKTSIGYFSLHDINSYPCEWGDLDKVRNASVCIDSAHGQSIWNVHLQPWKTEADFWALYESTYSILLEKTRKYLRDQAQKVAQTGQRPKAAIFLSAGFDASEWEGAGMQRHKVNVPTEFYARLTQDVVKLAAEEGLAVDGRVISVLEGGYSDRALCSGILSHLSGMVGNMEPPSPIQTEHAGSAGGLGFEMGQRIGVVHSNIDTASEQLQNDSLTPSTRSYNPSWWASGQLDQLEQPAESPSLPGKPRNLTPPTYSSPTQASTARVTDPGNMRRSLSSLSTGPPRTLLRPPSPPPPEVSWVVAAKELCNMLIPTDRQTDSYKAEELNAEASRARRDRQSILLGLPPLPPPTPLGPPPASPAGGERPSSRMSLRERRPRAIGPIDEETSETLPKTRRRPSTTPVASPMKATRGMPQANAQLAQSARKPNRRLSSASTTLSPPREEPLSMPSIPATAPAPRRTTKTSTITGRPGSQSGRAQSRDKVAAQKPRPAATRKEAPPVAGPRAVKTASTPARAGKKQQPAVVDASTPTPATGRRVSVASQDSKAEMDHLASEVKKIRINLITQSQREAKEKTKAAAESEELSAPSASSSASAPAPPTPSLSGEVSTPAEDSNPSSTSSPSGAVHPRSSLSPFPDIPHVAPVFEAGHVHPDPNDILIIPYQPEGLTASAETFTTPDEPLKWLPPHVSHVTHVSSAPVSHASWPLPSAEPVTGPIAPVAKHPSGLFRYQHNAGIPFAPRPEQDGGGANVPGGEKQVDLKATRHSLWRASDGGGIGI
ncbi:hypothetical protein E4U21_001836 [Claviceps maximensis]|nr:hypothetical protein E4U21_001836 [Claviceps maximensis]